MKTTRTIAASLALALTLSSCAGMSTREANTAVGAGVGAVGGALLTNGDPFATVGGAVVGGVIGHQFGGHDRH